MRHRGDAAPYLDPAPMGTARRSAFAGRRRRDKPRRAEWSAAGSSMSRRVRRMGQVDKYRLRAKTEELAAPRDAAPYQDATAHG